MVRTERGGVRHVGRPGRWLNDEGYVIVQTADGRLTGEHRLVWEAAHGPIPEGWHIHHRNEKKADNRLENLEALPWPEHKRRHEGHWRDAGGRWWKRCRDCGAAAPEDDFPTKRYVDGVRKTRGNCVPCERARQRAKKARARSPASP